jgi:glycosyltransferase involved in cell wall biosynthesis
VPVFNRATTVLSTLDTIAAQSVLPGRLIVIDDGSTDGGFLAVNTWIQSHRHLLDARLERQSNRGVSAARNRGLSAAARARFVAFLDSDDLWPDDFLERTRAALRAAPTAVAATCDRQFRFADRRAEPSQDLAPLAANPVRWIFEHGAGIASATLFRKRAIERRGAFDRALFSGEDAALFLPLSLDGDWLHVPGQPTIFERGLAASRGEEGNLSHKFRDNNRRWARVYEDFVLRGGGAPVASRPDCWRLLAKVWYRAGRELAHHGGFHEARACYRASLNWNRWSVKTWHRLARSYLAAALRRSSSPVAPRAAAPPRAIAPVPQPPAPRPRPLAASRRLSHFRAGHPQPVFKN